LDLSGKSACADLQLIVDNDSDLLSPTEVYILMDIGGDIYQTTEVSFTDGDYFSVQYVSQIVVDATQFYNGAGSGGVPDATDDCYKLLVKSTADGTLALTENAHVKEIEVESGGKLVVNSGVLLEIDEGVNNSGDIRMIGTSQLIQNHTGTTTNTGTGNMYIDQQGTNASIYRFNYWSSPVHTGTGTYTVDEVMKDGSTVTSASSIPLDINFISGYDGDHTTLPAITLSNYWIYNYDNAWGQIGDSGSLNVGEGYTLKGPGAVQNYTFVGEPNDGEYGFDVSNGDVLLLGNPYPSALDADAFITFNAVTNSFIDGSIYFWEHNGELSTVGDEGHFTSNYEGGYAVRNIGGGVAAVAPSGVSGVGSSSGIAPGQYIAVGQGFFVNAQESGIPASSQIIFNNTMRALQVEDGSSSVYFKAGNSKKTVVDSITSSFRLGFEQTNSNGIALTRQLLAVFKDGLSAAYDNGYDSSIYDIQTNDAYWKFSTSENGFVIAGVEAYSKEVSLSLEVVVGSQGIVSFKELEKYGIDDSSYLYDSQADIYYGLRNEVSLVLEEGIYSDRFFVVFIEEDFLAIEDDLISSENLLVYQDIAKLELVVSNKMEVEISTIILYNMFGAKVTSIEFTESTIEKEFRIKIENIPASQPAPDVSRDQVRGPES
jgi:hypothetical protein